MLRPDPVLCPSSAAVLPLRASQRGAIVPVILLLASVPPDQTLGQDRVLLPFERAEQFPLRRLRELHRVVITPGASVPPCGSKATLQTVASCPSSVRSSLPLRASQSFTVLSALPPWPASRPADQTPRSLCLGALRACGVACRSASSRASPFLSALPWPASRPADQTPRRTSLAVLQACGATSRRRQRRRSGLTAWPNVPSAWLLFRHSRTISSRMQTIPHAVRPLTPARLALIL